MGFIDGIGTNPGQYIEAREVQRVEIAQQREARDAALAEKRMEQEAQQAAKSASFEAAAREREAEILQLLAKLGLESASDLPDLQQLYDRANAVVDLAEDYTVIDKAYPLTYPRIYDQYRSSQAVVLAEQDGLQQLVKFRTESRRKGKKGPFEAKRVEYETLLVDRSYDSGNPRWSSGAPSHAIGSMVINGEHLMNVAMIPGETVTIPTIVKIDGRPSQLPPSLEIAKTQWVLNLAQERLEQ